MLTPEEAVRETKKNIILSLQDAGERIDISALDCERWRGEAHTCSSCSSNIGCNKLGRLLYIFIAETIYKREQPLPDLEAIGQVNKLRSRILNARTMDELGAIPWVPLYLELKSEAVQSLAAHIKRIFG